MTFTLRLDLEPAIFAWAHAPKESSAVSRHFRQSLERYTSTQLLCGLDTDNKAQCITRTTELNAVFISGRLRTTRGAEFIQTLESTWRCESNIWSPFHHVGHIAMTHQWMTPRCMKGQEQRYTSTGAEHSCSLQFKVTSTICCACYLFFSAVRCIRVRHIFSSDFTFLIFHVFWSLCSEFGVDQSDLLCSVTPLLKWITFSFSASWRRRHTGNSRRRSRPVAGTSNLGVSELSKPPESVSLFLRILLHPFAKHSWPLCQQQTDRVQWDANIVQTLCV